MEASEDMLLGLMSGTAPEAEAETREEPVQDIEDDDVSEKKKRKREAREEKKKKKKKRKEKVTKSIYIDDAASEGSEDEDEDDEEMEEETAEDRDYIAKLQKMERKRQLLDGVENIEEGDEAEIAKRLESRYLAGGRGEGRRERQTHKYSVAKLPRESDPKVFAVKCRPGMARTLVARIVNKCHQYNIGNNYEQRRVDLGIISVFAMDHIKEYIYVESHRQLFVENALNGLEGLFRFKITPVDPQELMQLLEYQRKGADQLRPGSLVRFRQFPYKLDLGEVVELVDDNKRAVCRVIPREDFVRKPFMKVAKKNAVQGEQKFFNKDVAIGAHAVEGNRIKWGELVFDSDGYLLKTVSARMLIQGKKMVPPSVQELAKFFRGSKSRVQSAAQQTAAAVSKTIEFNQGEAVRVAKGQLSGVIGTISQVHVAQNWVTLSTKGSKDALPIKVSISDIVKHFAPGVHVKVVNGKRTGETGTVISDLGSNTMLIVTDSGKTELEVNCNDCRECNIDIGGSHTFSTWRLFDLVMLSDGATVGCIAQLNGGRIVVVTVHNAVMTISPSDIKQTIRSRNTGTDQYNNPVHRGDEVSVSTVGVPMDLAGLTGRVEQVYHNVIFAVSMRRFQNSGLFAIPAVSTALVGGRSNAKTTQVTLKQLPYLQRKAYPATRAVEGPMKMPAPEEGDWDASSSQWK